jgi:hypothetical protein
MSLKLASSEPGEDSGARRPGVADDEPAGDPYGMPPGGPPKNQYGLRDSTRTNRRFVRRWWAGAAARSVTGAYETILASTALIVPRVARRRLTDRRVPI